MKSLASKKREATSTFYGGVLILSLSTIIVKIIGLVYKIPMLSYLGAEGMGYFNSAYEIYALLCVVSTAGLPVALSMLVSSYREKDNSKGIQSVYKSALSLFLLLGTLGSIVLFVFADKISTLIKNENAVYSIIAISPALFFVCISSAVRGYFQGHLKMLPTAVSQLIEAIGKLVFGIIFAKYALKLGYDLSIVAAFAVIGLSLGTFLSTIYLVILKLSRKKRESCREFCPKNSAKGTTSLLIKIALPITISSAVISITRIVDMALIMRRLQDIGYSAGVANAIYGVYTTVAVPIFSLVPSLLAPISMSLVPSLAGALERGEGRADVASKAIRITVFFAMPSSLAIVLYSSPIISLLFYNAGEDLSYASRLLSFLGVSILFSCLISTTNAILQSYRKVYKPIISMSVGALVKIITAYVLIGIPQINVLGAPISTFLCDLTIAVINLISVYRLGEKSAGAISLYSKPLIASSVSLLTSFAFYTFLFYKTNNDIFAFLIAVPIAIISYVILSFLTKSITYEDIYELPFGDKICRFLKLKTIKKI